jgi:glycosyltransferase involved in cell wall biosynthesis
VKFLLLNQFFPPDGAPTGQLLADVARSLADRGHSVTVVCARLTYAGDPPVGGEHEMPGIAVRRLWAASFGVSPAARLASYATFYAGALWHALFGPRSDVVLTLTTPPLLSLTGALAKLLRGSRHFSWEMDVYPDIAVDIGLFRRGSFLDRVTGALADFSRRRCDRVIALGPSMRDRLIARGIPAEKVVVAENWANGSIVSPRPFPPNQPLTILYSGNFGRAHDVDTIAGAMTRLSDPARFHFAFAGAGSRQLQLQAYCRAAHITNAFIIPYQVQGLLAEHLGNCHAGLVTQLPATCGSVVPSKTYAIMAAGRPFIYVGPAEANPARLVDRFGCGWRIEPGDSVGLAGLLESLAARPELLAAAGARARQAFLDHYDIEHGVARILKILGLAEVPSQGR